MTNTQHNVSFATLSVMETVDVCKEPSQQDKVHEIAKPPVESDIIVISDDEPDDFTCTAAPLVSYKNVTQTTNHLGQGSEKEKSGQTLNNVVDVSNIKHNIKTISPLIGSLKTTEQQQSNGTDNVTARSSSINEVLGELKEVDVKLSLETDRKMNLLTDKSTKSVKHGAGNLVSSATIPDGSKPSGANETSAGVKSSKDGSNGKLAQTSNNPKMVKVVLSNSALFELYEAAPKFPERCPPALTLITPIKYHMPPHVIAKMAPKPNTLLNIKGEAKPENKPSNGVSPSGLPNEGLKRTNPVQVVSSVSNGGLPGMPTISNTVPLARPSVVGASNGLKGFPMTGSNTMNPNVLNPQFMAQPNGGMAAYIIKNNSFIPTNALYPNLLGLPPGFATNLVFLTSPPKQKPTTTDGGSTLLGTPPSDMLAPGLQMPASPTTPAKTFRVTSDDQTEDDEEGNSRMRRSKRLATARINKQLATPEKTDSESDSTSDQSSPPRSRRASTRRSNDTADESDETFEASGPTGEGRSRSFRIRRKPEFLNIKHPVKKKKRANETLEKDRVASSRRTSTSRQSANRAVRNRTASSEKQQQQQQQLQQQQPSGGFAGMAGGTVPSNRIFTISSPISCFPASIIASMGDGASNSVMSQQEKYQRILSYCKAMQQQQQQQQQSASGSTLPQWYDVNYAYSGLHSIIHPPPPNVTLWGGSPKLVQHHQHQQPPPIECKFCFENYSQYTCQFYMPQPAKFSMKSFRRGKEIVCMCCDFSDDENEKLNINPSKLDLNEKPAIASSSSQADGAVSEQNEVEAGNPRKPKMEKELEQDKDEGKEMIQTGPSVPKRAKCEGDVNPRNCSTGSTGNGTVTKPKVKPGWYGKGYRKHLRRKKRASLG
ncbi:hypothetical protein AND_009248 [Anopheles darlingi]|uniref:Uncharacterized protein n=1 Tax=Anopheles darlingi TaxID=43151 RepID=W5J416_ANODA|nr:hypothetical protein AND_009248 [Anopheles darlingi]